MPKYTIEENRQWRDSLPTKRVSTDALFWNAHGELLVVKTNYRDKWQLPGGVVDEAESPLDAVTREVEEEIGLKIPKGKFQFKVVMYTPEYDGLKDFLALTFDGGILTKEQIDQIRLQEDELENYQFADFDQAQKLLKPSLALRVKVALEEQGPSYLTAPKA